MTQLAPITYQRLMQFRRRRNALLTVRGFAAAVSTLLIAALFMIPVDAMWDIPDTVRYVFAALIYTASIAILFYLAIGPWLRGRSIAWLATIFEKSDPRLKNRLLAAVELSSVAEKETSQYDSKAFRDSLQREVAKLLETIPVSKALPWRLIGRWLFIVAAILGLVAALIAVPNLHLGPRLARVLFPMANVGRISRFAITVASPESLSNVVPQEEMLPIIADIQGGDPKTVYVEVVTGDEQPKKFAMRHDDHWQVNWLAAEGAHRLRIVADDAASAWYSVEAKPRPKVVGFEIEYNLPDYAKLDALKVESKSGNLESLEGTNAKLTIVADQMLSECSMRTSTSAKRIESKILSFAHAIDTSYAVNVPIQENGQYRIDLRGKDSGFENTFSPQYSIRAIQDRSPKIAWKSPREVTQAVTPDAIITMELNLSDELPLASVTQQFRQGTAEWEDGEDVAEQLAIEGNPENQKPFARKWKLLTRFDMASKKVNIGEVIQTRWLATDRKGQSTASSPIEFFITSAALDPNRRQGMENRLRVTRAADQLQKLLEKQEIEQKPLREAFEGDRMNAEKQKAFQDAVARQNEAMKQAIETMQNEIQTALPNIENSVSSEEFERLSHLLKKLDIENSNQRMEKVDRSLTDEQNKQRVEWTLENRRRAEEELRMVSRRSKEFTGHDILEQMASDLFALNKYQKELHETVDRMLPEQFRRRQAIVARQLRDVASTTREQSQLLRDGVNNQALQWADWMDNQATAIEGVTGTEERPKSPVEADNERKQLANRINEELKNHQNGLNLDGNLPEESKNARDELRNRAVPPSKLLEKLAENVQRQKDPNQREKAEEEMTRLAQNMEQISHQRQLQQSQSDGDSQWIADLGETYRAANAIISDKQSKLEDKEKSFRDMAMASKRLEAVHEIEQASRTLDEMQAIERWKGQTADAKFEQPRNWTTTKARLERGINMLKETGVPQQKMQKLEELKWNDLHNKVEQKMGPRKWSNDAPINAAEDVKTYQNAVREQAKNFAIETEEARAVLAAHGPSISDLAKEAAANLENNAESSEKLSSAIEEGSVPDRTPRIEQLQREQAKTDRPIDQLQEALADFASRQDLLKQSTGRKAKDADAASSIAEDAQKNIDESLDRAKKDASEDASKESIDETARIQHDAAEAMEMIADHFDRMKDESKAAKEAGENSSSKLAGTLAEAASKLDKQPSTKSIHDEADRLRKLASSNPERVLAQLEKELPRNTAMQNELSKISRDAVDETIKTLRYASDRENNLQVGLENSDEAFREKKDQLTQSIHLAAETASRMTDAMVPRVQSAADRGNDSKTRAELDQLRKEVAKSIDQARKVNAEQDLASIVSTAKALGRAVEQARKDLSQKGQSLDKNSREPFINDENQLRGRKQEMEDWQRRYRDEDIQNSQQMEQRKQDELNRVNQKLTDRKNQSQQRKNELDEAKRQAAEKPDDSGRTARVLKKEAEVANAQKLESRQDLQRQDVQKQFDTARARREQFQNQQPQELSAANPHLQLASRTADAAADAAKATSEALAQALAAARPFPAHVANLQDAADNTAGNDAKANDAKVNDAEPQNANKDADKQPAGPEATFDQLTKSTDQQQALKSNVEDAGESIARASRHENRLKNKTAAVALKKQSDDIDALAQNSMSNAAKQLETSKGEASAETSSQQLKASSDSTAASQKSIKDAKTAIDQTKSNLESLTAADALHNRQSNGESKSAESTASDLQSENAAKESSRTSSTASSSLDSGKSPRSLLSPEEMARMLDELDQQLNSDKKLAASEKASSQSQAKKGESQGLGKSSQASDEMSDSDAARAATLADAARRLSAEMNQQRRASEQATKQATKPSSQASMSRNHMKPPGEFQTRLLPVEVRVSEDWGNLREQDSEDTSDTAREGVAPGYRQQVDDYFKILSSKNAKSENK